MKHTVAAIFFASFISQAGEIATSAVARDSKPASANLDFAGTLTFPGFDPSLGELTSISFNLRSNARLTWQVTQSAEVKYTVFASPSIVSFLGIQYRSTLDQLDLPPRSPCGPCPLVVTDIGRSGVSTIGTITPDGALQLLKGGLPGKSSVPFSAFVGKDKQVSLPVSTAIEPTVRNIAGDLTGEQKMVWNLAVTYNYK